MKKNAAKRTIYTRVFSAFLATYLLLMSGFSIFVISVERKMAGMEFQSFATLVNNQISETLKDYIDSNNQVTDLVQFKKKLIENTFYFSSAGTELAVFSGDYQLLFHANDYWLCSYTERTEGTRNYTGYGYLNPREWFSEKEITELEDYLYADPKPKKAGDLYSYAVHLKGFWIDQEMIIPDKITVNPMYADTFDEFGNVRTGGGTHTDKIVYSSGYENPKNLPYFQHGSIQSGADRNRSSETQAQLRKLVTNREKLKETVSQLERPSTRVALTTYRYYLPMPYMNVIQVVDEQKYYSEFWTVIARDINMWERCATTLIFVWISCMLIFFMVAFILSRQTYKTYKEKEKLEKQRQEMTNALAHDLKTPLSIISGYAQNLKENVQTEKRDYYAGHIQTNVERMDKIIRGMLDMTRIESVSPQINIEDISLAEASREVMDRYLHICQEKSIMAKIEGDAIIKADHALMVRVIDNFFVNALENTPADGSISIKILDDRFEIYNSGSHIPEDRIDEIWLPFKKADLSRSHSQGTGLGLAITRTILELHKFTYGVRNHNEGVVFWFKFRCTP